MNSMLDEWDNIDEDEPEVVVEVEQPELSAEELQEAKQRLVRVACMGLPLDRIAVRAVLGCTQHGYSSTEDLLDPTSDLVRRDTRAILHLLRNNRIKIGKFLSPAEVKRLKLQNPV